MASEAEQPVAKSTEAVFEQPHAIASTSKVNQTLDDGHDAHDIEPKKPHPADLISSECPDPHVSPLPTPAPEAETGSPVGPSDNQKQLGAVLDDETRQLVEQHVRHQTRDDPSAATNGSSSAPTPPSLPPEQTNGIVQPPTAFEAAQPAPTPPKQPPAVPTDDKSSADKKKERESARSRRQLGEYTLTKTIGAGSMGKVKLGVSNVNGEKVAIKVVPRFTSTAAAHRSNDKKEAEAAKKPAKATEPSTSSAAPATSGVPKPSPSTLAKAAAKDASKEVRTMREGAIGLLLHHPYVCGMKSMILYPHHYYMVYEYINGGQMLDYIISHGRLRERSARKFARHIGSALEYCHANSIVHRDLKIENILISKTGNIKIIDFGLSNLYSPQSLLNTFCGSLYFAAPELLNAKLYTGPEVDVWSFGIVLYVLVCGKVPFDDQSMPALHAKIKRGQVEYPAWLSAECKHLLSRMLVTNPSSRATLTEVLNHPWMTKGYNGPPDPHLPARAPLRVEDIDLEIVKGMVGFEFGTADEIYERLSDLVQSDLYRQTVRAWEQRKSGIDDFDSRERPATRVDGKDLKRSPTSKRFSGLGFYGKKIAGNINAAFSINDKKDEELTNASSTTLVGTSRPDTLDPTRGFNPLLSVYYLVREKQEREKIYGAGHFASSTVSLTGPPPPPAPIQAYSGSHVPTPPEPMRRPPGREPEPVESPSASGTPKIPMTPQPRQRATGDEYATLTAPPGAARFQPRSAPNTPSMPQSPLPATTAVRDGAHDEQDQSPTSGFVRRFGSLLGRSSGDSGANGSNGGQSRAHRHRASVSGTVHRATTKAPASQLPQVAEGHFGGSDVPLPSPPDGKSVQRASTVGNVSPGDRHGHGRYSTSIGRAASQRPHLASGDGQAADDEAEQLDAQFVQQGQHGEQHATGEQPTDVGFTHRTASPTFGSPTEGAKPVWLKGLFSVSTTTTKPTSTIRADLVRVLDRLGVQYREVKSGFECVHVPSIDLNALASGANKKTPKRRTSKLFLSNSREPKDRDAVDMSRSSLHAGNGGGNPQSSTSWTVLPSNAASTIPQASGGAGGSTSQDRPDLIVRFEIFIVKMPLLPGIHGIQFRRIGGDSWQYQLMAKRILQEIKL